jgi:hypothetical protein
MSKRAFDTIRERAKSCDPHIKARAESLLMELAQRLGPNLPKDVIRIGYRTLFLH